MTALPPNSFADPLVRPVRFIQRVPPPVFAMGESSFPVSFSFRDDPRPAIFLGAAVMQLGVVLTDKETHVESDGVIQFASGSSQTIELRASSQDISSTGFFLRVPSSDGGSVAFPGYSVAEIRQPSFDGGITHAFLNGATTTWFDPVSFGGDLCYPAAAMSLSSMPTIDSDWSPAPVEVPVGGSAMVEACPPSRYGVVDMMVDVVIRWYEDSDRTIEIPSAHPLAYAPSFGIRLFVSRTGKFSRKVVVHGKTCTVETLYPTVTLRSLGGESVSLAYWGGGADGNGVFWGREDGIMVSNNGLAIQGGSETAAYVLGNQLDDYDSSSSSLSSASSLNSQSSSSTGANTSSMSSSSTTSQSSMSSRSSSSRSSRSFSSSSSSSTSSMSSVTSATSLSTVIVGLTSSSSLVEGVGRSSSSSLIASILAQYGFETAPSTDGKVADDSGNGNELSLGTAGYGFGPPTWGVAYGRSGNGGFRFYADPMNASYLSMPRMPWSSARGTVSFWERTPEANSDKMTAFCVSNGAGEPKTEIGIGIKAEDGAGRVVAWAMVDGTTMWEASSPPGTFSTGSAWHNIVLVQDGSEPKAYVDGKAVTLAFSTSTDEGTDKGTWMSDAAAADYPASQVMVGAASRGYSPYVVLGFSGWLDEITLWDEALSASDVDAIYHSPEA